MVRDVRGEDHFLAKLAKEIEPTPISKLDHILKVHNTQKTISKFEEYKDSIKVEATKLLKKHHCCITNKLLRFHNTRFVCSLNLYGSSNLYKSIPHYNIYSITKKKKGSMTSWRRGEGGGEGGT